MKSKKIVIPKLEKPHITIVKKWRNKLRKVPIVHHAAAIKHPGLLDTVKKT